LGNKAKETWKVDRFMDLVVAGILSPIVPLFAYFGTLIHFIGPWGGGVLGLMTNVFLINYFIRHQATEFLRKRIGSPPNGRNAPFDLFIIGEKVISSTQRNFFSRILTNRFKNMGPAGIYDGVGRRFVAKHASDEKPGDINLKFSLRHKSNEGRMSINQSTFPQIGKFGTKIASGKAEVLDVVVDVPQIGGIIEVSDLSEYLGTRTFLDPGIAQYWENVSATQVRLKPGVNFTEIRVRNTAKEGDFNRVWTILNQAQSENKLMDDTIGTLGLMIAAKTVGVQMAVVASNDGKWFDLKSTFSSAGTHTTQVDPVSDEAREMLGEDIEETVDAAQTVQVDQTVQHSDDARGSLVTTKVNSDHPGGISMNSRLMRLKITGEDQSRAGNVDNVAFIPVIKGIVPKVSAIVTVTPDMLKAMLGTGYLN
jgi:hypothetical protein